MKLNRQQAAVYLGCSIGYLNNLACTAPQSLPFIKIGKSTRYQQTDLDKYIKAHTRGAG